MRLSAKRRGDFSLSWNLPSARRETIRLDGRQVDVTRLGAGDPVVLVPGLAGGWKLLAPLARRLARSREVILYGLRGDRQWLGATPARSMGDYADDLGRLVDRLGLERPTIFGVSFGGAVALEFAVENPGRLGGLVVQGAEARFRSTLGARIARSALQRFPLPSDSPFLNQFFNLLHAGRPEPGPLVDFIVERCWETDQAVMARRLGLLETFDVSDRLWRVEVPTLVLGGSRDAIVPASQQRALAEAIPGARFEAVDGAGHVAFLTHRVEVARRVARFAVACRAGC